MPLIKSASKKAFNKNVGEMVDAGHPVKQAVAAAYSTKRKAQHSPKGMKAVSPSEDIATISRMSGAKHGHREGAGATNPLEVYNPTLPGPAGPKGVQGLLEGSGGPTTAETRRPYGDQTQKDHWDRGQPHAYKPPLSGAHGYGHDVSRRSGAMRLSGHSGAHRIGNRSK